MSIARKVKRGAGPKVKAKPGSEMVFIPGGEFTMGSDHHYAEEKPAHRVKVDGFWIDTTPVTNAQFRRFVKETGHVTFAEIAPDPRDYPGALPHMLRAGSLVFVKSKGPVDLRNCRIGGPSASAPTGGILTGQAARSRGSTTTLSSISPSETPKPTPNGPARSCRRRPSGNMPRAAG
jgi:formylglycine-generating enzyme required for sulfatase activity